MVFDDVIASYNYTTDWLHLCLNNRFKISEIVVILIVIWCVRLPFVSLLCN